MEKIWKGIVYTARNSRDSRNVNMSNRRETGWSLSGAGVDT